MRTSQLVYLIAQVSLAIFNWLILTVLAKNFSKSLVGEYSIILAWLTPIFLLYSLQIKSRYLTSLTVDLVSYVGIRLSLILPLIILILPLFFLNYPFEVITGVFLLKLAELLFELPFMKNQKDGNLYKASLIQLVKNIFVYSLILVLSISFKNFFFAIIIGGITSLLISIAYNLKEKVFLSFKFDKALFFSLLPLGIASFITSFIISIPRFYLKWLVGIQAVALYTVIFSFYAIWQLLFNNYFTGVLENMHKIKMMRLVRFPLIIFFISAMLFCFFDEFIYKLLFGSDFIDASKYTYVLLLNIFISFWCSLLYYKSLTVNDYSSQLKINTILLLSSIFIMPVAIIKFHIYGAFVAQALIQLIQVFLYRRYLIR